MISSTKIFKILLSFFLITYLLRVDEINKEKCLFHLHLINTVTFIVIDWVLFKGILI